MTVGEYIQMLRKFKEQGFAVPEDSGTMPGAELSPVSAQGMGRIPAAEEQVIEESDRVLMEGMSNRLQDPELTPDQRRALLMKIKASGYNSAPERELSQLK